MYFSSVALMMSFLSDVLVVQKVRYRSCISCKIRIASCALKGSGGGRDIAAAIAARVAIVEGGV